jgi:hypothetical protein
MITCRLASSTTKLIVLDNWIPLLPGPLWNVLIIQRVVAWQSELVAECLLALWQEVAERRIVLKALCPLMRAFTYCTY